MPNGATYGSHDDLCVDQCMGVGLYNGSNYFNHRGAPTTAAAAAAAAAAALLPRWSGHVTPARNLQPPFYNHYPLDLEDFSMSFRPGIAASQPNPYQPWFGQQLQQRPFQGSDDDCQSMGDLSCCDSQCTMTGKCTNIACANKEDACTDQSCPGIPANVPAEIVDGAAALISINHAPEQQHHNFGLPPSVMDGLGFGLHGSSQNHFMLDSSWLPSNNSGGNITSHILVAHPAKTQSNCTRPCPLDDPRNYSNCHVPMVYDNPSPFDQYGSVGSDLQLNQDHPVCGAEIPDPEAFLAHFNARHRPFFTSNAPELANTLHGQVVLPSNEAMSSSPITPLDTTDSGASTSTPSPFTPLSNNMDISDMKQSQSRSHSVVSSEATPFIAGPDDEHRCLWREESSSEICGQVFEDPGDLFTHTANDHIKYAKKGSEGFRCGWDDCPRSGPDATGFPQRSKIERHMQTHIGHKPHVCPTCHKGFSAKQALNQHMFIHTNQKPLECEICHKAFRYPSALTMHQRVHTGDKPLKCPICGKSFSESSNLSKHKRTHEVKGRFTCEFSGCDRNFHRQDQLRRHMKTHKREGNSKKIDLLSAKLEAVFDDQLQC
ncbi:hypothetical protein B0T26DRAFT_686276 [Lasiosphaeria miniovina]|uniref:C2H2-type domain-containing protein n=1 Tax=Lasiosphaeria miniovina TaxID=1954250 RepID=A0AA40EG11_9PEZI|nr:uncharacterized protein B0T26DRAFT_686276 [Lasiosphaeria miniovina]KAK0733893.1 hypothetical protein B0T26DRAFT_686276 [Lasiosphaeria miniovina]